MPDHYDICRLDVNSATICVVDALLNRGKPHGVMDTDELLARLASKGVKNIEIARALDLPDSRIPEIKDKRRAIKLDEAATLVRVFELGPDSAATPLPPAILRLVVQYVAVGLGVPPERTQARVAELAEDLRAFGEFVADPKVRSSLDSAEAFFRAMALRRPTAGSEAPPGNDPEHTH